MKFGYFWRKEREEQIKMALSQSVCRQGWKRRRNDGVNDCDKKTADKQVRWREECKEWYEVDDDVEKREWYRENENECKVEKVHCEEK